MGLPSLCTLFHFLLLLLPFPEFSDPEVSALLTPDAVVCHVRYHHHVYGDQDLHHKHERCHGACFISADDPEHSQECCSADHQTDVFQNPVFPQFSSAHCFSPPLCSTGLFDDRSQLFQFFSDLLCFLGVFRLPADSRMIHDSHQPVDQPHVPVHFFDRHSDHSPIISPHLFSISSKGIPSSDAAL